MYVKTVDIKGRPVRYLCVDISGCEVVLGWLDNFNNLHSK